MLCPNCKSINPDGARFCSNCGKPLEAQPAPRVTEGERKMVTVLFADVVGSTAMGERLDPEQVTDVMNGAFAFMNASVNRYGGTVSRLMGDAVLAIFGAPAAHEDDPERAVRAGLDMQAAAADYAAAVAQRYGVDFHVRVGIHTGLAVLDQVGDRIRTEYTAMGDTPNVAARMQSAAVPGTVLVSADTYRLARHVFDFEPRGALEVKGKSAPIEAWQANAVRDAPASARGLEGLRAPMVGREREIQRLRVRLAALEGQGVGGLVTIMGEAGLGKSRLMAELRQSPISNPHSLETNVGQAGPQTVWLEGRCISYGQAMSYLPWRQVIRQSIGALEGDSPEAVRGKLEYSACECCHIPGGDVPFLEAMLAVASEDSLKTVMGLSGDELVVHLTDAVRGFLCGLAQTSPLVIVFDDLHWADDASIALLENVCDLVPLYPMLIISLLRPDRDAPAWAFRAAAAEKLESQWRDEIALEPLSTAQARDLLGMLLHIEDLPDGVRGLILEKSEGNPFFVEEVIRSLLDGGHIVHEQGRWRATHEIAQVAIPSTLAGLLAARIDALPDDPKRVAQMSAVIGRSFAFRVLDTVCADAPAAERLGAIAPHLDLLSREEIVRVRARQPELEYAFKHALTQEAAYNSLLIRRRREFHGRAGKALEALYAGRLDEYAPALAHHYRQAENWERAAAYAMRAGESAQKVYALREAIRQFDHAIEALDKAGGGHDLQLYDALLGWARAASRFRPYPEQLERLGRAEQIARRLGDKRRLAEALQEIGGVHVVSGHAMRAAPVLSEAFHLADDLGDETLAVGSSFHAAFARASADPQAAAALFEKSIALTQKYARRDLEAYAHAAYGMLLARLGRADESRAHLQTGLDIVYTLGSPLAESDVELFSGWAYMDLGDAQAGLRHGQRGVQQAIATDNFDCICGGLACVGFGHMQNQQLAEATRAFEISIHQSLNSGAVNFQVLSSGGLALAHLAAGRPGAVDELEQAIFRAGEIHDAFTQAIFAHAAAEARLAGGDLAAAEAHLDAAIAYFESNNVRPYLERAQATRARLREKQTSAMPGPPSLNRG